MFWKQNKLPRILLIGDSIRMRYAPFVKNHFKDTANVIIIKENCEDSQKVLTNLSKWLKQAKAPAIKIIHFNCGLHDIKRKFNSDINQQPLPQYENNLKQIVQILKEKTDAQLIWATTTPVIYELHHKNKGFDRFEQDVDAYNIAAKRIIDQNHIPINDLNTVIMNNGKSQCISQDGVHMNERGNNLLANAVISTLTYHLSKP
jgi:lysophospholipase L1-like esterase